MPSQLSVFITTSRTQYIFKGIIISSIHKPHRTISCMCRYIVIFCLSHSFLLKRSLEKYIDKPHHCISRRVESVVKKSQLMVRNLRYLHDNRPERPITSWLAGNLTWPTAGRYHSKPFSSSNQTPECVTARWCMRIAGSDHL